MNEVLPTYVNPCVSEVTSLEDYPSTFGEYYPPPPDNITQPRVVPVYNGKVLDIQPEFVHASLSGISIKHYDGKCVKVVEDSVDFLYGDNGSEGNCYDWDTHEKDIGISMSMRNTMKDTDSSTMENSTECTEDIYVEGQPLCTMSRINYRNSFWNIHRPELCKLTWGQKYVGTSTVTEHLHEHLVHHGALCAGFHTPEDREFMLNKELDEYVRLKVLLAERKLPPDEPLFDFRKQSKGPKQRRNPKCKTPPTLVLKTVINHNERFLQLSEDEGEGEREGEVPGERPVRRSKEEFCLTIGRPIRKQPVAKESVVPEEMITPQLSFAPEEEGGAVFFYNWLLYSGEGPCEDEPGQAFDSTSASTSEPENLIEPCPPLMLDEFCRAAGKVDFSDWRCDPDF